MILRYFKQQTCSRWLEEDSEKPDNFELPEKENEVDILEWCCWPCPCFFSCSERTQKAGRMDSSRPKSPDLNMCACEKPMVQWLCFLKPIMANSSDVPCFNIFQHPENDWSKHLCHTYMLYVLVALSVFFRCALGTMVFFHPPPSKEIATFPNSQGRRGTNAMQTAVDLRLILLLRCCRSDLFVVCHRGFVPWHRVFDGVWGVFWEGDGKFKSSKNRFGGGEQVGVVWWKTKQTSWSLLCRSFGGGRELEIISFLIWLWILCKSIRPWKEEFSHSFSLQNFVKTLDLVVSIIIYFQLPSLKLA